MPSPKLDVMASLLFDRLLADSTFAKSAINFPDLPFTPPRSAVTGGGPGETEPAPYVSVSFIPNTSDLDGMAFDSGANDAGLLGLNVVVPAGQGVIAPIQLAQRLAAAFAPGTVLSDATSKVQVRIYEQPRLASAIEGTDNVTIPVIVRWVGWTPPTGG